MYSQETRGRINHKIKAGLSETWGLFVCLFVCLFPLLSTYQKRAYCINCTAKYPVVSCFGSDLQISKSQARKQCISRGAVVAEAAGVCLSSAGPAVSDLIKIFQHLGNGVRYW